MSKPVVSESPVFVRRTHTAKSITIREVPLLSYLISKAYASPAPKGFTIDRKALSAAFSTVAQFVTGAISEAEAARAGLAKAAKGGDEGAAKQLKQIDAALAEMEKQKKNGQWDRITQLVREAKPKAVKASASSEKKSEPKKAAKPASKGASRPEGDGKGAARKPSRAERKVQRAAAAQAAQAAASVAELPPAVNETASAPPA